ncbi:MAG TPA: hypothetical protein DCX22_01580 [Dehalococcoidia bacterium]|nr:hypothetical protein [Dehalococcoidia bacterium]
MSKHAHGYLMFGNYPMMSSIKIPLMLKRFLSHFPSSKECSIAFMTSKTSNDMKTFSHMKAVTTTSLHTGNAFVLQEYRHRLVSCVPPFSDSHGIRPTFQYKLFAVKKELE